MAGEKATLKEVETAIIARTMKDDAFRKEFLADPKGSIEKYSGQKLPADVKIFAHTTSSKEVHFVIPDKKTLEGELSDADLEKVAGGEFFVTATVISMISGVVVSGATIANDQTRARAGW
jgi:hypothetical protein